MKIYDEYDNNKYIEEKESYIEYRKLAIVITQLFLIRINKGVLWI